MAVDIKLLSERLLQARMVLGYTVEQVRTEAGIDADRLLAIESGAEKPSGDEILILATFYNCDYRAFLDGTMPAPVQQSEILFRKYGDTFRSEDRRAIQEFLRLCEIEAELEIATSQRKERLSFKPSGSHYKTHGQQAAEWLRSKLGYQPNEAPRDIYSDFRSIGIHIFRRALSNPEISGLYIEHPTAGHCVLVNYDEDVYRQRFSVSHEIAHAIFDSSDGMAVTYQQRSAKYNRSDLKEIRANSFASHYLMPRSMLEKLPRLNAQAGKHWAQEFRVSTAALANALRDAGLIDEDAAADVRSVRVSSSEKIDPEASSALTPSQRARRLGLLKRGLSDYFVNLCFEANYRGVISFGRLAECLRVRLPELPDLAALYGRTITHGI